MELNIGDYIRTSYGEIGKYLGKDIRFDMYDYDVNGNKSSCKYNELIKHSPNIIDLIEVGDYVNGKRVIYVAGIENEDDEEELCAFVEETQDCIEAKDIKTIVTKEQFKNVIYEV